MPAVDMPVAERRAADTPARPVPATRAAPPAAVDSAAGRPVPRAMAAQQPRDRRATPARSAAAARAQAAMPTPADIRRRAGTAPDMARRTVARTVARHTGPRAAKDPRRATARRPTTRTNCRRCAHSATR